MKHGEKLTRNERQIIYTQYPELDLTKWLRTKSIRSALKGKSELHIVSNDTKRDVKIIYY